MRTVRGLRTWGVFLCFWGCNNSSSTTISTKSSATETAATTAATGDVELLAGTVAEDYVVACGRTQAAPDGYTKDGHEALACAVLNAGDNTRAKEAIHNLRIHLTLDDTTTIALQDEEQAAAADTATEGRAPLLTIAQGSTTWHYFFQLVQGEWERVQSIESHLTIKGTPIVKVNAQPHSYDPEAISANEESL